MATVPGELFLNSGSRCALMLNSDYPFLLGLCNRNRVHRESGLEPQSLRGKYVARFGYGRIFMKHADLLTQ